MIIDNEQDRIVHSLQHRRLRAWLFCFLTFCSNFCFIFVYNIGKKKDVSPKLHLLAKYSNKLTRSKSEDTCDAICILERKLMQYNMFRSNYIIRYLFIHLVFFYHLLKHPTLTVRNNHEKNAIHLLLCKMLFISKVYKYTNICFRIKVQGRTISYKKHSNAKEMRDIYQPLFI